MRENGVATLGRLEVHPIPRRAINNIPILDTIHLEINRQPIGKPGQIDFEIDNLRSLARSLARSLTRSFVRPLASFYSFRLFSGKRDALNSPKCLRVHDQRLSHRYARQIMAFFLLQ